MLSRVSISRGSVGLALMAMGALAMADGSVANVAGTWNMKVQSNFGASTPVFVLTQKGDQLTGTYTGPLGTAPVTGAIRGNALLVSYKVSSIEVIYRGTVADKTWSGEITAKTMGMESPQGKFTGMRQ